MVKRAAWNEQMDMQLGDNPLKEVLERSLWTPRHRGPSSTPPTSFSKYVT